MTSKPSRSERRGLTEKMPYWSLRLAAWCMYELSFWPRPAATLILWAAYIPIRVVLWIKRLNS